MAPQASLAGTYSAEVAGAGGGVEAQQEPGDADHVVFHEGLWGGRGEQAPRTGLQRPPSLHHGSHLPGGHRAGSAQVWCSTWPHTKWKQDQHPQWSPGQPQEGQALKMPR